MLSSLLVGVFGLVIGCAALPFSQTVSESDYDALGVASQLYRCRRAVGDRRFGGWFELSPVRWLPAELVRFA